MNIFVVPKHHGRVFAGMCRSGRPWAGFCGNVQVRKALGGFLECVRFFLPQKFPSFLSEIKLKTMFLLDCIYEDLQITIWMTTSHIWEFEQSHIWDVTGSHNFCRLHIWMSLVHINFLNRTYEMSRVHIISLTSHMWDRTNVRPSEIMLTCEISYVRLHKCKTDRNYVKVELTFVR